MACGESCGWCESPPHLTCDRVCERVRVACFAQAGGYTVMDFVKFGGPLLLLSATVTCLCATLFVWGHDSVVQLFDDDV